MNFLVDNQLPNALCSFLTAQGHQSRHVLNLGMDEATDLEIWKYATHGDWIVVSKDDDFLHLANRAGDSGKLLWVRIGNCERKHYYRRSRRSWLTSFGLSTRATE